MRMLIFFASIMIIIISSCKKPDVAEGTPKCIKTHIKYFQKHTAFDTSANVKEYLFHGKVVYVFYPGTYVNSISEVWDSDCKKLGSLGGGVFLMTKINGEDFYATATFNKIIWKL